MTKIHFPATLLATLLACAGCASLCTPVRGQEGAAATVKVLDPNVFVCLADGSPCDVTVHVNVDSSGACVLMLPEIVDVRGRGIDRLMHWKLVNDSTGYEFRFRRITFTNDTQPPQFERLAVSPDGQVLTAFNKHTVLDRAFSYTLDLLRKAEGGTFVPCGVDPVVVNHG